MIRNSIHSRSSSTSTSIRSTFRSMNLLLLLTVVGSSLFASSDAFAAFTTIRNEHAPLAAVGMGISNSRRSHARHYFGLNVDDDRVMARTRSNRSISSLNMNSNTNTEETTIEKESKTSNAIYAVNLKLTIKDSRRNDFLTLIQQNQQKTLSLEPAALQYVVGEDIKNKNTFYLHEEFIGEDGFDQHRTMPHNADWAAFKDSNPFTEDGNPTLDFYYVDSKYDDVQKEKEELSKVPIQPAYCVHVELYIKPELRDQFIDVIHNNQRGSYDKQLEPLCLQYSFGESTATECKFVFHEQYTDTNGGNDDDGFVAHTKSPHFKVWEDFVEEYDPFTRPPVVDFFKTI